MVLACYLGETDGDGIHLMGPLAKKVIRVAPPLVLTEHKARKAGALLNRMTNQIR